MKELNTIYLGDAAKLISELEITPQLIIMSPPDMSDTGLSASEYVSFLHDIYHQCSDKLADGGVLASITTDRKHNGSILLKHSEIINALANRLRLFNYKIWAKSLKTNLYILNYAHMLFFTKGKIKTRHNITDFFPDVWLLETDKIKGYKSKDTFPTELVKRIVCNFTNEQDIVFDPFIGTGKTATVAKTFNRNYIGFEIKQDVIDIANNLINNQENNIQ